MSRIKKWAVFVVTAIDRVGVPMAIFCGILITLVMLATVYEVLARYLFRAPTIWSNEISSYLVVAATFLGLAYALLVDGHVRVDIVLLRFSERGRIKLNIISYALALIYAVLVTWKGWQYAWLMHKAGEVSGTLLRIPLFPVMIFIPIGGFMLCLQFLSKLYHYAESLLSKPAAQ